MYVFFGMESLDLLVVKSYIVISMDNRHMVVGIHMSRSRCRVSKISLRNVGQEITGINQTAASICEAYRVFSDHY